MSINPPNLQGSLFSAGHLAAPLFNASDRYRIFREKILPLLYDARPELEKMYCSDNGRPAFEPVVLMGATILQYIERMPDRDAADAVRLNIGWKFALNLDLSDRGFHATSLVVFRDRLLKNEKARLIFDVILGGLKRENLIKSQSRARLDSTHVLGLVSKMSRLQLVRQTLREALEELNDEKDFIASFVAKNPAKWALWWERYIESRVDWRLSGPEFKQKHLQTGVDALAVLEAVATASEKIKNGKAMALLTRVFDEQYEIVETDGKSEVTRREKRPTTCVINSHDPDAQIASKDKEGLMWWTGYKAQVLETVVHEEAKKRGEPTEQFLLDVVTTQAIASDFAGMKKVFEEQTKQEQAVLSELYVDAAYVSDDTLKEAKDAGMELIGPARSPGNRTGVLGPELFRVNIEEKKATCPAGGISTQCSITNETYYRFEWGAQCDKCDLQKQCTTSKTGRRILTVGLHHDLLQQRRDEMRTPEFQERYKNRAGIEGTISELARGHGMRRTRYRGLKKTILCNLLVGAACNTKRWLRLIAATMTTTATPQMVAT